jgi:hypothetical protein
MSKVSDDSSKSEISKAPTLEYVMRKLEKLKAENKKLRVKGKKTRTYSSSSEDSNSDEEVIKKGRKGRNKHDKASYNTMSFNYNNMPSSTPYASVPIDKAPRFDGSNYNQWKNCMKNYLYSISPEVWQVVCDGVDFPNEDEQPTLAQLQKIHRNAQAISILTSSIDEEEFNSVDGLDVAKDVWTTLRLAHEGSKPMRNAKIEMLEGQLNRLIMFDDESSQDMFNQLKKIVNKAKTLGSKKWTDRMLTERLMRVYTPMNHNVVALICQDPTYKKMTSDDVLGRIINHEMYIEEFNHIKNLYKGVSTSKKQDIALKASNKSKKKIMIESPSEEEEEDDDDEDEKEYDEEEMTLFIKKFNKFISKRKPFKGDRKEKSISKRVWYNCAKSGHFITQCPYERKEQHNDKKFDKSYKKDKKFTKKKPYGQAHVESRMKLK